MTDAQIFAQKPVDFGSIDKPLLLPDFWDFITDELHKDGAGPMSYSVLLERGYDYTPSRRMHPD